MLLLISYDLKSSDKDYNPLYEGIKNNCSKWWHYMESVWIVKTDNTPNSYVDMLKDKIDKEDRLFVVDISHQKRQGWLLSKAWDWIKANDI